ncbi:hypothetical protein NLO413_0850 [Candidatus Neoehrlichia lotoris str. RAC413]|uniref:Uncharacterized protein n=1 Tax=Candidatus Neoehrlichia procyonis str. RAC413 TaxID=1359163 RepID=A0A0F3NP28_9RICK|nr:hypothetical protein NLO413_0850 [Candidatus Neoehrlichia lotoris str. RAC413]
MNFIIKNYDKYTNTTDLKLTLMFYIKYIIHIIIVLTRKDL